MTAAAGFPIASLIPGAQKTQGQPGKPAPIPAGSAIISFRAGFQALVSSTQQSASEAASSEAVKGQLTEDTDAESQGAAKHDLLNSSAFGSSLVSAQSPQATALSRSAQSNTTASAASQSSFANSQPVMLPAAAQASSTTPASKSKPAGSEHSTQAKPSTTAQSSSKGAAQASTNSNETLAQAPVHIPDLSHAAIPQTVPASQLSQTAHSTLEAEANATSSSAVLTSAFALPASGTSKAPIAALSTSVATSAAQQAKTAPAVPVPVTDESHLSVTSAAADATSSTISTTTEAPAAHSYSATNSEATAQPTPPRTSTTIPSSADSSTPQSLLNSASAQLAPGNVDNPLQPAIDAPQATAANLPASASLNHGPALRERGPLQRESAASATPQISQVGAQSTLVRDPSGLAGVNAERAGSSAQNPQAPSAALTMRDAFAALDADPGQSATTWTHTTPRQVEAGYQDPSLGWVSVRADLTPGGLHASVIPNSPEAAQALGSHLSGLNAYLAEHHGSSITATIAATEDRTSTLAQNGQSGSHSGARQQNESSQAASQSAIARTSASSAIETGVVPHTEPALFTPTHNGRISVLA
jgi:hypothetical protein